MSVFVSLICGFIRVWFWIDSARWSLVQTRDYVRQADHSIFIYVIYLGSGRCAGIFVMWFLNYEESVIEYVYLIFHGAMKIVFQKLRVKIYLKSFKNLPTLVREQLIAL